MDEMKKPAWFELADGDKPAKVSAKPTKNALAVIATLAITSLAAWGFIGSDEPQANAIDVSGITANSQPTAVPESNDPNLSATSPDLATSANSSSTLVAPSSPKEQILPPTSDEGSEQHEFGDRKEHHKKEGHEISSSSKSSDDDHDFGDDD